MSITRIPRLPRPPDIPGLWFRPYRGDDDLPAIVEVMRAADEANGETIVAGVDRVRNHYRSMTRIDPREDVLLASVGSRLVANSVVEWADTSYGERHSTSLGQSAPNGVVTASAAP